MAPGIGNSAEDRVVISVDRTSHWIRRFRITLDGLESARGAIADIYLRDHIRISGILFPTAFYEELKKPFMAPVHHWRLTAIDLNRQLTPQSLNGPTFIEKAAEPAGSADSSTTSNQNN